MGIYDPTQFKSSLPPWGAQSQPVLFRISEVSMSPSSPSENKPYQRLFIPITRETLPRVSDKYPFLYLERGRLEIDDSSLKWIDAGGNRVRLPVATIAAILLGPGTSVTHEAVKTAAAPTVLCAGWAKTRCSSTPQAMPPPQTPATFSDRHASPRILNIPCPWRAPSSPSVFPTADLEKKSLQEMMGMEGLRVRSLYEEKARQYNVGWKGRSFTPGKFELSDLTNQILTSANAALYGILCSCVHSLATRRIWASFTPAVRSPSSMIWPTSTKQNCALISPFP